MQVETENNIIEKISSKKTYKDYEQLPEGAPYQLINGELVMSPSPVYFHQKIIMNLINSFSKYIEQNKVGEIILSPMDVYLTEENVYQPDIIFISNENKGIIKDRVRGVPDFVIEVLSPTTGYYDLVKKKKIYEQTGVKEYWIIDPEMKTVEVLENKDKEFQVFIKVEKEGKVKSKLLNGFEIDWSSIFSS
ncbi:MAG: Uma2 family endonuclease [Ignavibacterium sp.]